MRHSPFRAASVAEHRLAANNKVRSALSTHGDDGAAVRHVLHFLFKTENATCSEQDMAERLSSLGFEVDLSKCTDGVIAEEHREVASSDFDASTLSFSELAEQAGWTYDGFECAVELARPTGLARLFKALGMK